MRFNKLKLLGASALIAMSIGIGVAHAATNAPVCNTSPTQEFTGLGQYTNSDGTTVENLCARAILKANQSFDQTIDRNITNQLVLTALNTMAKESPNNPEAKKLQEMYRTARAEYVNNFIKDNELSGLPTANDGRRKADNYDKMANSYADKALTEEKVSELTQKFREQAKKSIAYSISKP